MPDAKSYYLAKFQTNRLKIEEFILFLPGHFQIMLHSCNILFEVIHMMTIHSAGFFIQIFLDKIDDKKVSSTSKISLEDQ